MTKEEFKHLYDNYFDSIRNYIYFRCGDRDLATDVAQDTFVKVWEKNFNYENKKTVSLLYKIVSDIFISKYRKQKTEQIYINALDFDLYELSPDNETEYMETKLKYEKALTQLDENDRIVFLMSRTEDLKYHEIAERLNISQKAIEKRMSKALSFLRKELL